MGASCACESKEEPNIEVAISVQKEAAKEPQATGSPDPDDQSSLPQELVVEQAPRYTQEQVALVQSIVRAYLIRKQQVPLLQDVIVVDLIDEDPLAEETDGEKDLGDLSDLMTPCVKEKLEKMGPYVYQLKVAGGQMRKPVQFKDGSVYHGQWLQGKRHGRGKYLTKDGGYMEGYWNGFLHLHGREITALGESYEGGYENGKKNGFGRYEDLKGGNSYEGEWVSGKKQGKGVEKILDGSVYTGEFEADEKGGYGVFEWANGEVYEGCFKNGVIHGKGKYVWKETKWYEGEWMDGKMHGMGHFMNEGKEYEGNFFEDKKQGTGVYKWDGNVYEGDFKDNKMHGRGYLTMKGRERRLYNFENNKRGAQIQENTNEAPAAS